MPDHPKTTPFITFPHWLEIVGGLAVVFAPGTSGDWTALALGTVGVTCALASLSLAQNRTRPGLKLLRTLIACMIGSIGLWKAVHGAGQV
jgi:hypothetical protein